MMWYSKQIQLPIWQKHAHKCNLCFTLDYIFVDFHWNITHTLCSLAGLVVFLEGWVLTGLSTSFSCILSRPPWVGNEIGGGNDVSLVAELSVPLIVLRPSTALQNPKKINFEHHLILQNIQILCILIGKKEVWTSIGVIALRKLLWRENTTPNCLIKTRFHGIFCLLKTLQCTMN